MAAQAETQYLNMISGWVAQTSYLSGVIPRDMEVVLRILRPSTALQLIELDAARMKGTNPTVHALEPVFFTAARLGVEFGINTLREAAEIRSALSAIQPQKLQPTA